jgi:hypothetical protein
MALLGPKTYLIIGSALHDVDIIQQQVAQIWWRHGVILTADDHGVCAEVAYCAEEHEVACRVVGLGTRPTNGCTRGYLRVIVDSRLPRAERRRLRDQFLVQLADYVITIGEHRAYAYARSLDKRFVYHHENQKPGAI